MREVGRIFTYNTDEDKGGEEDLYLYKFDEDEDPRMREVKRIFAYISDEDQDP
jgi:hypothetical protein